MNRREFLLKTGKKLFAVSILPLLLDWLRRGGNLVAQWAQKKPVPVSVISEAGASGIEQQIQAENRKHGTRLITLFLCGDVMTGRGIDQVLPHPGKPQLYESYMKSARGYVELAEQKFGPLPRGVPFAYIWGDVIDELARKQTDVKIINLETAVTKSDDNWPRKGIHYRMHPDNIGCITAAGIDCCVLANNHVLDWGYAGLDESLRTLRQAHIQSAGVGKRYDAAIKPAILPVPGKGRVLIFAYGSPTSGIPYSWAATKCKPGVNFLNTLSAKNIYHIAKTIAEYKQAGDIVVVSIHWGRNWGYVIPDVQVDFAHRLIATAGADIIHGHSSHHPKAVEIYQNKPIIYGCGDFINDYEGISGHEPYRGELGFMYFVRMDSHTGKLIGFELKPTRINRFRVNHASERETEWLYTLMQRECKKFACSVQLRADNILVISC